MAKTCTHLDQIQDVNEDPRGNYRKGCEECVKIGAHWVHLRICLICGHVGCCDSSQGKHASKHAQAAKHPIAQSLEPGEEWAWCYVDQVMLYPEG